MKEILTIGLGQAGCQITNSIVETFSRDHGIQKDGFMSKEAEER